MDKTWGLKSSYDYRFGSVLVQLRHKGETSPIFNLDLKALLKSMPRHEVLACLQMAEDPTIKLETDMDLVRERTIKGTELKDKVVLDIGGYDGWAAKLALDCGAKRAICLDNEQYHHYGWPDTQYEGVEYSKGDFMRYDACKFAPNDLWWGHGEFSVSLPRPNIIIFYNVLYHLKNPWAALDKLRELIKPDGEMLLCTLFRYHDGPWMYVYEPRECNPTDDTVYFGPSLEALERLLKATGWDFQREGLVYDRVVYRCKPTPNWSRKHQDT